MYFKKSAEAALTEERKVVRDTVIYLTIDTNVFNCSEMPGTTLPEPFGLTNREVHDSIRDLRGLKHIWGRKRNSKSRPPAWETGDFV